MFLCVLNKIAFAAVIVFWASAFGCPMLLQLRIFHKDFLLQLYLIFDLLFVCLASQTLIPFSNSTHIFFFQMNMPLLYAVLTLWKSKCLVYSYKKETNEVTWLFLLNAFSNLPSILKSKVRDLNMVNQLLTCDVDSSKVMQRQKKLFFISQPSWPHRIEKTFQDCLFLLFPTLFFSSPLEPMNFSYIIMFSFDLSYLGLFSVACY